ncbi:hypothetical protein DAEQUDRAFT_762911 [Daedalea quercina L-15889]|uniref:Aminoacyl-transfer RNA synthetases class-II family profile domain-containing protein n=1 Tax=Daedalea quercina L-15889 TaxID=1314783 RepID=A0A165SXM2_9APHY|nr:hypothetical protein DAEQUDRAFT_762911 [Daedalea quercina L-15889]
MRANYVPYPRPSHNSISLTPDAAESKVILAGWLVSRRKGGKGLSFFGLKDARGTIQLVATESEAASILHQINLNSTVLVQGVARMRPEHQRRPHPGGNMEVAVHSVTLLNPADSPLPFDPQDERNLANEHMRLQYRYLDLRRSSLAENIKRRSEVAYTVRTVFHEEGFTEVETPILLRSTPEGAREFLVPTRLSAARVSALKHSEGAESPKKPLFYALTQSPQQPKQLLIASGAVDRYYQLARCFRDEDGRKDRQPEFTQVDLEMAWVSWGEHEESVGASRDATGNTTIATQGTDHWRIGGAEVRDVVERIVQRVWAKMEGIELPEHFRVMTYSEAMARYGSDKPDLRFGLEVQDITPHLPTALREVLERRGEIIEALCVRNSSDTDAPFFNAAAQLSKSETQIVQGFQLSDSTDTSWLCQNRVLSDVSGDIQLEDGAASINRALMLDQGGYIWLSRRRRKPEGGSTDLGRVRLELATLAESLQDFTMPSKPHFLWVTEFPLFTRADADKEFLAHGRWSSSHHPFTAPMWQDVEKMYSGDIEAVRGQHYDLVLNGVEIGGGSVRIHDAVMQDYVFQNILELDKQEKASFNHLLHALRCGAPPHGGFAFGFDRLMAILCKTESIRDVIAFPKTGAGTDLLFRSPAKVRTSIMAEYGIQPL